MTVHSTEAQRILRYEFIEAVTYFIAKDIPVYLEGFGIFSPELHTEIKSEKKGNKTSLRSETFRSVVFEKCYDLISFHRDRVGEVADLKELVQRIYPRLPLFITSEIDERALRSFLKLRIQEIKESVIHNGFDFTLGAIGELYALHNRQGSSPNEWYAGADIFLKPKYHRVISQRPLGSCEQPVLTSAWEPLEAAFGTSLTCFKVDLVKELSLLGYDASLLPPGEAKDIKVAAFRVPKSAKSEESVLFCSDGLRNLGLTSRSSRGYGNEIVFQLPLSDSGIALETLVDWAQRPFTLAWMLMQSAPSKTIRHGAGLASESPLFAYGENAGSKTRVSRSPLHMILTTHFNRMRLRQTSSEGSFNYLSIVGITEEEGALISHRSAEHLITLLARRELLFITRPYRPSILLRTEIVGDPSKKLNKGVAHPHGERMSSSQDISPHSEISTA